MESNQPKPRKLFARRRFVLLTFCALLIGLIVWFCIRRPDSLQRQVEALGGSYVDKNLDFPPGASIWDLKSVAYALFQQAQGNSRRSISISLFKTDVSDDWVRRNAAELKRHPVHYLDFRGTEITDDALTQLSGMEGLSMLFLSGTSITDRSMTAICKMPSLKFIELKNTNITQNGISQLEYHPTLQNMEIDGDVLTTETVTSINTMPQLRSLGLKDFNNDQLDRLCHTKRIQALSLTAATDESLTFILRLNQLKFLSLVDSQLSADSIETIHKTFPNLDIRQHLSFERAKELGFYELLAAQNRVKYIAFVVVTLGGGGLVLLLGLRWRRRQIHRRRQQ